MDELLVINVKELDIQVFFDQPENQALVQADGPYAGLNSQQLVQAYESLVTISEEDSWTMAVPLIPSDAALAPAAAEGCPSRKIAGRTRAGATG